MNWRKRYKTLRNAKYGKATSFRGLVADAGITFGDNESLYGGVDFASQHPDRTTMRNVPTLPINDLETARRVAQEYTLNGTMTITPEFRDEIFRQGRRLGRTDMDNHVITELFGVPIIVDGED